MITDMLFSLTHWELAPKYVLSILDPSRFKLAPSLSESPHHPHLGNRLGGEPPSPPTQNFKTSFNWGLVLQPAGLEVRAWWACEGCPAGPLVRSGWHPRYGLSASPRSRDALVTSPSPPESAAKSTVRQKCFIQQAEDAADARYQVQQQGLLTSTAMYAVSVKVK